MLLLRKSTTQQGLDLFARLTRMLLGESAMAERKLECGDWLTILGVEAGWH